MACKKKLSIIIPVYNTEKYLVKCLESVAEAVDDRMEVLIINDGSPDHSEDIALDFIKRYPDRFVYYKKENGGLSDVKNFGLERAGGDYVIFLDSDDYIEPGMYKDMLAEAEKTGAEVVVCDIWMDYEEQGEEKQRPKQMISCVAGENSGNEKTSEYEMLLGTWLMPASWNKMVRRDLYVGLPFPKGLNNEDIAVTPVMLARAKKIAILHTPYYHYLQRSGSIQNSGFDEKRFVLLDTVQMALERISEVGGEKEKQLRDTLLEYQILAAVMYQIRSIKDRRERERLLAAFMGQVYRKFPDFIEEVSVRKYRNPAKVMYRKVTLSLLKKKKYHALCSFWELTYILIK